MTESCLRSSCRSPRLHSCASPLELPDVHGHNATNVIGRHDSRQLVHRDDVRQPEVLEDLFELSGESIGGSFIDGHGEVDPDLQVLA